MKSHLFLTSLLHCIRRFPVLSRGAKKAVIYLTSDEMLSKLPQELLDIIYFRIRRHLQTRFDWRRNPNRTYEIFNDFFEKINKYTSIEGKSVFDLGSGKTNPLGLSALFYLNGCRCAYAFDKEVFDHERCAAALYELLLECFAFPTLWLKSGFSKAKYKNRLKSFDMKGLKTCRINGMLSSLPFYLIEADINHAKLPEKSIDIMYSQAVFEHLLEFDRTMTTLYKLMAPKGIMVHHVDFRDHRILTQPGRYHWWSFLEEDQNWSDNLCNRLRPIEMKERMELAGFKVVGFEAKHQKIPKKYLSRMARPYSEMPLEELETTGGTFTVLKP